MQQLTQADAQDIIESLRKGTPPKRFVTSYSVGHDVFLSDVTEKHLKGLSDRGKIRFVSGSWGAGKTHFLRLLREAAFDANYLVSSVDLSGQEGAAPFHKFELVFYEIVRKITTPEMYRAGDLNRAAPFGEVIRRVLFARSPDGQETVAPTVLHAEKERLFNSQLLDVDFRRIVTRYWETYLPEAGDVATLQDVRDRLLQWFSGEGTLGSFRSAFGVNKIVTRQNARLMLQSLSHFATHAGYKGLVILIDEAEGAFSSMRKPNLQQAHNNLLYLINNVDETRGLFLVYATTLDFFMNERYGIIRYGALAQRIGRPEDRPPQALDRVWNLDSMATSTGDYEEAAARIRAIYLLAYPESVEKIPPEPELRMYVRELVEVHPEFSQVNAWRVVAQGTVDTLDQSQSGEAIKPARERHDDIMQMLPER